MNPTTITKLPDGSGCFIAEVMSKEEAMKLPREKRPLCFRISSATYHGVFEAIGSASMCWNPRPSNEVFNSDEASKVAVDLCFKIADEQDKLADEIEKLKAALTKIASYKFEFGTTTAIMEQNSVLEIAREALGEKK